MGSVLTHLLTDCWTVSLELTIGVICGLRPSRRIAVNKFTDTIIAGTSKVFVPETDVAERSRPSEANELVNFADHCSLASE